MWKSSNDFSDTYRQWKSLRDKDIIIYHPKLVDYLKDLLQSFASCRFLDNLGIIVISASLREVP